MVKIDKEKEFIELFQNTGLKLKDSLVFFTLIKLGSKGSTVLELQHHLSIKRTTIYSILRKLINLGHVKEKNQSERAKNATIFTAINPTRYFNCLISKKKDELERFQDFKKKYSMALESIYKSGITYLYEDLNKVIQPYFKSLLEKGWKILKYIEEERSYLKYFSYELGLYSPMSKYLKENGFIILIYDFNIEKNEPALRFVIDNLKKESKKMSLTNIGDVQFHDEKLEFFNKTYTGFNMLIKQKDLKNSKYFSNIFQLLNEQGINDSKELINIHKFVVLPIKEKIFYLWAESHEILNEMVESIFKTEKIK